jgi:hypothetical protein
VIPAPARPPAAERAAPAGDRALLRAYEPVLRFTEGELFLPTSVASYVGQCSLWAGGPDRAAAPLVPAGGLTLDGLAAAGERFRATPTYLRLVQRPLTRAEMRTWRREDRPRLRGAGRLAAVGVLARLVDVLLRISLLVRGRVPGGLVAAAHRIAGEHLADAGCPYYGRVVRDGGYTVLQYWYFYAFNDWRSTFHGVNDHEADWELVAVVLVGAGERLRPAWVVASSHDHHGDALRRRWDDPALRREADHAVVFPGAGSHSGATVPGDYLISVELPLLRRVLSPLRRRAVPAGSGFSIPFVDYARGDGVAVGPGHGREWRPELIDDETPWVRDFRGLWGLDTRDAFGGERAPAGPRYERSGAVRASWADPLGWAGLGTVAPTVEDERAALRARLGALTDRLAVLDTTIAEERTALRGLRAQARSLGADTGTRRLQSARLAELRSREAALTAWTTERTDLREEHDAHVRFLGRPADPVPADDHLRRLSLPGVVDPDRHTALLRVWAAVSSPLLILGIVAVLVRPTAVSLSGFTAFLVLFAGAEVLARHRVRLFLTGLAAALLWVFVAAGLVLALLSNWHVVLAAVLTATALCLLVLNLRELAGRRGRRPADRPR